MALSPLQDLMRRVAALEERRGPDLVVATITEAMSSPSSQAAATDTEFYRRWRFDVQTLDRGFQPTGGVIRNVPALLSHLTLDGVVPEIAQSIGSSGTLEPHSHDIDPDAGVHTHGITQVTLEVGDIVMLARARLGTGSYWVIAGRLDPGTMEAIENA